uniref:Uncharacterized protein n=1 Tax=Pseudomonas phage PACT201 TaxID=3230130 RepID=A0AAU8GW37_9VIRU
MGWTIGLLDTQDISGLNWRTSHCTVRGVFLRGLWARMVKGLPSLGD